MEESFRNSLIIISALIIGAIFVHGLWTIRKNKNPYKLKANPKDIESQESQQRDFDRSGFDQDGVSQVKVVSNSTNKTDDEHFDKATADIAVDTAIDANENAVAEKVEPQSQQVTDQVDEKSSAPIINNQAALDDEIDFNIDVNVVDQNDLHLVTETPAKESVYKAPVSKPKPVVAKKKVAPKKNVKRNQMEINFDEGDTANQQSNIEPEVLAISVIVPQGQIISGAALLPSLLTLGMKYGDMNVFHRHQDNAGNGKVTFSLVNAVNPGTFDLDNMENFVTQGVSLFMTLPNAGDPFEVFDQMLVAAKQLALEFNGQLLDDKRSVLTKQTEQHYVTKIREFERKSRIASL